MTTQFENIFIIGACVIFFMSIPILCFCYKFQNKYQYEYIDDNYNDNKNINM
jgi:hypothetical protein